MTDFFEICGTRIPVSSIKDYRVIEVEFIFRPVYREIKKSLMNTFSSKKFEFVAMQPYAAIIGQQGHKSALGEYKAKDFKEALGKDLSGAVIYTIADKLKLKAFKHQKYQCLNLAGRAFTTYLDDVPVMLTWNDGRLAEVYKEDPLYESLTESTTPGVQFVPALVIKANEIFCFYGNEIQITDVGVEYERLKQTMDDYFLSRKKLKRTGEREKISMPLIHKLQIPSKTKGGSNIDVVDYVESEENS